MGGGPRDAMLWAMLLEAYASPDDPSSAYAVADHLTELDEAPGAVLPDKCPVWLRLAWRRARRGEEGWEGGEDELYDMGRWLGEHGRPWWHLDHFGATRVGGLWCFASEPYLKLREAVAQAALLAGKTRCVGMALPGAAWHKDAVRVLLLPHPPALPESSGAAVRAGNRLQSNRQRGLYVAALRRGWLRLPAQGGPARVSVQRAWEHRCEAEGLPCVGSRPLRAEEKTACETHRVWVLTPPGMGLARGWCPALRDEAHRYGYLHESRSTGALEVDVCRPLDVTLPRRLLRIAERYARKD
jgi:hypothetical protein